MELTVDILSSHPQLEIRMTSGQGVSGEKEKEVVLSVVSDETSTRVSSYLLPTNSELVGLSGFSQVRVVIEFQGEGIFMEVLGEKEANVGDLEKYASLGNKKEDLIEDGEIEISTEATRNKPSSDFIRYSEHGWKGNSHEAWSVVQSIDQMYVGGSHVKIEKIRAYVLV